MIHVIILAGGSISGKLTFLRSRCPSPALIPVNTRPLAGHLIDFYAGRKNCRVRLAVNAEVADTVQAELGSQLGKSTLLRLAPGKGVVDSLAQALVGLPANADVIVNLVTTVPTRLPESGEIQLASGAAQSDHWSGVVLSGRKARFSLKSAPLARPSHAFTGILRCPGWALKAAVQATKTPTDLLAVVVQLQSLIPLKFVTGDWIDCGHETNYYEAKAKLISSRSFNRIQVSLDDGVLRKQSEDGQKLAREVNYVEMLPAPIRVYYPRILGWSPATPASTASVSMEYYGYPSVAEYFLYWDLSPDNWRRLFARLEAALRRFTAFPGAISQTAFQEFYLQRTNDRIQQFHASVPPALRRLLQTDLLVNGRKCRPWSALLPQVTARLARLYREKDFCVMHGDFCFNNILYDVPSGIVRLIDPRGSFGERCVGIQGDQKYDLAKLKHSAEQGYDFLVNGLFTLQHQGREFTYTIATRECSPLVAQLSRTLVANLGQDNREIDFLTSLLFLSMGPLHAENPDRQLTMYVHGLLLLNQSLEK